MTALSLELIWMTFSIAGLAIYLRLRYRAALRSHDPDVRALHERHPIRILAGSRLRNVNLWVIACAFSLVIAISGVVREAFTLPWEVPSGIAILTIFYFIGTAVAVGFLDERDERIVATITAKARAEALTVADNA